MSAEAYLFVSCAVLAAIFLCSLRRAPQPPAEEPPPETGRWRCFRVLEGALGGPLSNPTPAIVEEPSGLRLDAAARPSASDPVRIAGPGGRPVVTVRRGWLFGGKFRVKIDGRPALEVAARGAGLAVRTRPELALEARGDIRSGNYEIRHGGKLVAMSFRDGAAGEGPDEVLRVEVLREEDPVLPLALALAVAVAGRSRP
jgi:hypothetical protein